MASRTAPSRINRGEEARLDRVFGALANGTRRRLLLRLAEGPASVSELAAPFSMTLPAVSGHLRVLEQAGMLRRRKDGRVHHCALDAAPLRDASEFVEHYRAYWQSTLAELARYAESDPPDGNEST
jgi:DNA-binding transcriptional ArsR family regulator